METPENIGLVEKTYENPFMSIISYSDISEYKENDLIRTLWFLGKDPRQVGCLSRCYGSASCIRSGKDHRRTWIHGREHIRN